MNNRKRICQMCGVEFEVPESWENDYTIVQKQVGRAYNIATLCENCTPKYFRTHRAVTTKSLYKVL